MKKRIETRLEKLERSSPGESLKLYQGWDHPDLYYKEFFDRRQIEGWTRPEAIRRFEGFQVHFQDIDPDYRKLIRRRIDQVNAIMEGDHEKAS